MDKIETVENVLDEDDKSKYSVAVGVFTVFFILILVFTVFLAWQFFKNRKVLLVETKSMTEADKTLT